MNFGCNASSGAKASILRIPQQLLSRQQGAGSTQFKQCKRRSVFFWMKWKQRWTFDDHWCWHFCSDQLLICKELMFSILHQVDQHATPMPRFQLPHVLFILMTWLHLKIVGPDAPLSRWSRSRCERTAGEGEGEESVDLGSHEQLTDIHT